MICIGEYDHLNKKTFYQFDKCIIGLISFVIVAFTPAKFTLIINAYHFILQYIYYVKYCYLLTTRYQSNTLLESFAFSVMVTENGDVFKS